jgi:hypothetical protein
LPISASANSTPLDPSNRRVSLIVQYTSKDNSEADSKPTAASEEKKTERMVPTKPAAGIQEKKPDATTPAKPAENSPKKEG